MCWAVLIPPARPSLGASTFGRGANPTSLHIQPFRCEQNGLERAGRAPVWWLWEGMWERRRLLPRLVSALELIGLVEEPFTSSAYIALQHQETFICWVSSGFVIAK